MNIWQDTTCWRDAAPADGSPRYAVTCRSGHAALAGKWCDEAQQRLRKLQAPPFLERCAQDMSPPAQPAAATRGTSVVIELSAREREIEYHLSRVYEKLGISNRRALRDQVQRGILTQEQERASPFAAGAD
ncbi:hypothetical protein [Streptomyces sp. NPDC007984]|uniref:hypothetical protein n=1 Tax=Streptomyces sp. NPDC007984 TaxID=3364801 RepID=UPI0036E4F80C